MLSEDVVKIVICLSCLIGAAQCFFGYRIFKFVLGFIGFLVGMILAGGVGHAISHEEGVALLSGIIGGFICAWLTVLLYFLGNVLRFASQGLFEHLQGLCFGISSIRGEFVFASARVCPTSCHIEHFFVKPACTRAIERKPA